MRLSPEQVVGTISAVHAALENNTEIVKIVAVGNGLSCRDLNLDLSVEDSKPVLEAVLALLQSKVPV